MSGPWWEASDGALDGGFRGRPLVGDVAWGTSGGGPRVGDLGWGSLGGTLWKVSGGSPPVGGLMGGL